MIIYNTVDVEITDHWLSYSENLDTNLLLPYIKLADYFCENEIKSTFFLSIAPKSLNISWDLYSKYLKLICRMNEASFSEYVKIQPHLHCLNLPFSYTDKSDAFSDYSKTEQIEMLDFAKSYLGELGIEVTSFRPGGFKQNSHYYDVLSEAGYKFSSTLSRELSPNINLVSKVANIDFISTHNGIVEFPVTSVFLKSVKGSNEIINLSPDFFEIDSIIEEIRKLERVVTNFHSFSLYHSRPVREIFRNRRKETIKHLLRELLLKKFAALLRSDILTETIYDKSLKEWVIALGDQAAYKWIGEI